MKAVLSMAEHWYSAHKFNACAIWW